MNLGENADGTATVRRSRRIHRNGSEVLILLSSLHRVLALGLQNATIEFQTSVE